MKDLLRLEMRMDAEEAQKPRFEQCAGCGRFNALARWARPDGGHVWLQAEHECTPVEAARA